MKTFETRYTIHSHKQKRGEHWDLRILSPRKSVVWSFAIPKSRFPDKKNEKILLIQTEDHPVKWLSYEGTLKKGDVISILETSTCTVTLESKKKMSITFNGEFISGNYTFYKISIDNWLMWKP